MTNSIKVGASKFSFEDLVKESYAKNEQVVKTASAKESKKEKDEAPSSGQPEAEAKLTNHPKVEKEKKDSKKASEAVAVKKASGSNSDDKAETSGQLAVEPLHQKGESVKPSAVTDANKKTEVGGSKSAPKKEEKKEEKKDAAQAVRFVKISKLNGPTKAMLRKYWANLYPTEYVDAMLAEK